MPTNQLTIVHSPFKTNHLSIHHQMTTLTLHFVLKSGRTVPVAARSSDSLDDIADLYTLAEGAVGDVTFVSRGRVLAPQFSVGHHELRDGDRVFVHTPRPKRQRIIVSRRAARAAKNTPFEMRRKENARLSDLAFASWEMHGQFGTLMNAILKTRALREECEVLFAEETVVDGTKSIREDPLPVLDSGFADVDGDVTADVCVLPVRRLEKITEDVEN